MQSKDAFAVGFIGRCVDRGLTVDQIKAAADKAAGIVGDVGGLAGGALSGLGSLAKPALFAAGALPLLAGGAAGFGLAHATDIDDADVKDVQHQELLDTINTEKQKLQHSRAVRDMQAKQRMGRPIT